MAAIHPYQWQLLAAMISYKVSDGLCLDFNRLDTRDLEKIYEKTHITSKNTFLRWGRDKKPVDGSLDALIEYISDLFPYKNLHDFTLAESDAEQFHKCPSWNTYFRLVEVNDDSQGHKLLMEMKVWAYERVVNLSKRNWTAVSFSGLHSQETSVKKFAGEYKYFMPGQIPPTNYDDVYENPLIIESDGAARIQNKHIQEWYHGNAIIKDRNALQIIFFSEKDKRKDGFEYAVSIKVNNYGVKAKHFAGITLGFTGNNNIFCYPILVTKNLSLDLIALL